MKKWVITGAVLVVAVIVVLVLGMSNLGPMIKKAVNTYGPKMTKTEVRVADVGISIFSGQAKLKGFYLGNPKGFKSPDAVKVKSVYVNVDEGSLMKETVIIEKIKVESPEITYEKVGGSDNFKVISRNVNEAVGSEKSTKTKSAENSQGKKVLIRHFVLTNGKVNLSMPIAGGKSVTALLPDIHLKEVGGEREGVTPAQAFEEILAALYEAITSPAVTAALKERLKALGVEVTGVGTGAMKPMGTVSGEAKKQLEDVADKVKGVFGK
jgi:uncharacterized protein involved in outer membrane biogenesis